MVPDDDCSILVGLAHPTKNKELSTSPTMGVCHLYRKAADLLLCHATYKPVSGDHENPSLIGITVDMSSFFQYLPDFTPLGDVYRFRCDSHGRTLAIPLLGIKPNARINSAMNFAGCFVDILGI